MKERVESVSPKHSKLYNDEICFRTEIISKRRSNVKHFDMGAGRYQMVAYGDPVHYQEDGVWKEIDNTLIEDVDHEGREMIRNKANSMRVEFACEEDDEKQVRLRVDGKELYWGFKKPMYTVEMPKRTSHEPGKKKRHDLRIREVKGEIPKLHACAEYSAVAPDMNVRYELKSNGLKEDIILNTAEAIENAAVYLSPEYNYRLRANDSVAVMGKNGENTPFVFCPPFAYDARSKEIPVNVKLETDENGTCLRYVIDDESLSSAVFPITIDPVVETKNDYSRATFCNDSTNPTDTGRIKSGRKGNGESAKYWVSLLRLNDIGWDGMTRSDTVTSAYLELVDRTGNQKRYVGAYRINHDWDASTVTWDTLKCSDVGKVENERLDPEILDCVKGASKKGGKIQLNITRAYRHWKATGENMGVLLCQPHMLEKQHYMEFDTPKFKVNYTSHSGLADWWEYESQSVGRAGAANVDIFNGNLVFVHPDMQMNGNRMPIGVSHYYNSCLSGTNPDVAITETNPKKTNDYHCGRGFKLNVQQCVDLREAGGNWFFVWTDGSGLEHWFKKVQAGTNSSDLEGMGYKLKYNKASSGKLENITITDKSHTVMTFKRRMSGSQAQWKNYWLMEIKDSIRRASGVYNKTTFEYKLPESASLTDASAIAEFEGMVVKIVDSSDRAVEFVYNESNRLAELRWPGVTASDETVGIRNIIYQYTDDLLTGIGYYDMQEDAASYQTTYSYMGGLLVRAKNYDGRAISIEYNLPEEDENACHCGCPSCCGSQDEMAAFVKNMRVETSGMSANGNPMVGQCLNFDYGVLRTKVTAENAIPGSVDKPLVYHFNNNGNVVSITDEMGCAQFARFEEKTANQPTETSRLMKVVINKLRPFNISSAWMKGESSTAVVGFGTDNKQRMLGVPTAKLPAPANQNGSETTISQQVKLARNKNYTLSAYVHIAATKDSTDADYEGVNARLRVSVDDKVYESLAADMDIVRSEIENGNEGWTRIILNFPVANAGDSLEPVANVELVNAGSKEVFFGWPQLEEGTTANHVNLLDNVELAFEEDAEAHKLPYSWKFEDDKKEADENICGMVLKEDKPSYIGDNVIKLATTPEFDGKCKVIQDLPIVGSKNEVFTFGGWAKAISLPGEDAKKPYFDLAVSFRDASTKKYSKVTYLSFDKNSRDWQFACRPVIAPCKFSSIRFHMVYSGNMECVYFAQPYLSKEEFGRSYVYDDDKDVISVTNRAAQKTRVKYDDAKNITTYRKANTENDYKAYYGGSKQKQEEHIPQWTQTPTGVKTYYAYDDFGNVVKTNVYKSGETSTNDPCIGNATVYSDDGQFAIKSVDARGKVVEKSIDPNLGLVREVTDPNGTSVAYEYDDADRVVKVSCRPEEDGDVYQNTYTYENDRLKTVSHNTGQSIVSGDEPDEVTYTFEYDGLGRKTAVKVGDRLLSRNHYRESVVEANGETVYDRSGLLEKVEYGNGAQVVYEYDSFNRLKGVSYGGDKQYSYDFDAEGRAASVEDKHLKRRAWTEYDLSGRPIRVTHVQKKDDDSEEIFYSTLLNYNKDNSLKEFRETTTDKNYKTKYTYDKDDRVTNQEFTATGSKASVKNTYDGLGLLKTVENTMPETNGATQKINTAYTYLTQNSVFCEEHKGNTAPLVTKLQHTYGSTTQKLEYTYDDVGNILTVTEQKGSESGKQVAYTYDKLGQLISVTDPNDTSAGASGSTWEYEYDLGGNIKCKKLYVPGDTQPQKTINYAYDSKWRDLLTTYDGKPISYDEIGNPIEFDGNTYVWTAGRQLECIKMRPKQEGEETILSAQDGVDTVSGTILHIHFTDGNQITDDNATTTAVATVSFNGRDVTADYEPLMQWKRKLADGTEQEMTEFAGKRSITLDSSYVTDGDIVITCTITPPSESLNHYGSMEVVKEGNQLVLKHTPASVNDPGHEFEIMDGELVLIIPEAEEVPSAEVENVTEADMADIPDDIAVAEEELPDTVADGEEEADIVEPEEAGDAGTGTYVPGEEEAEDYVEEINDTVDVFVEIDDIEDEDTTGSLKGNNYVLEDGMLSVYMTLNQPVSAYATVYSTEPEEKVEFKYNANGLRTQKKHFAADGSVITTDYTLHGKLITHLTKRTVDLDGVETSKEELHFFYDAQSRPAMVEYNGAMYSYLHNLQGDIIGIVDAEGNLVVEYKYDAWGKPIYEADSMLSTLGNLNPFRYRGYVWDEETELYYLRSRYYWSEGCRFLSADTIVVTGESVASSHNVYTYCENIPTSKADENGNYSGTRLTERQIRSLIARQRVLLRRLRRTDNMYNQLNPFKTSGDGVNKNLQIKKMVQRNYYVFDEDTAKMLTNKVHNNIMSVTGDVNNILGALGFVVGKFSPRLSDGISVVSSLGSVDVPDNVYVNMGVYTTQLLLFEDVSVTGRNVYLAKRTISVFQDSPLNSDWTVIPMYDTVMTDELMYAMCIM